MNNMPCCSDNDVMFMAREASSELLSQLTWMTIKPSVILVVGWLGEAERTRLQQAYPMASILHQHRMEEILALETQSVDLIFANFFLPWESDMTQCLTAWRHVLRPHGLLMLSALGLSTLQEWQSILSREQLPQCIDMHDIGDALVQVGFSDPVLEMLQYDVEYRDPTRLLSELQESHMWMPSEQTDVASMATQLLPRADGIWPATYEIIYAHAFAPVLSDVYTANAAGEVRVPLAQLRQRLRG